LGGETEGEKLVSFKRGGLYLPRKRKELGWGGELLWKRRRSIMRLEEESVSYLRGTSI